MENGSAFHARNKAAQWSWHCPMPVGLRCSPLSERVSRTTLFHSNVISLLACNHEEPLPRQALTDHRQEPLHHFDMGSTTPDNGQKIWKIQINHQLSARIY